MEGATAWRRFHRTVSPLQREMRPSVTFEQPVLTWIDNPDNNIDRQRLEPQGGQFLEAAMSNIPPDWLVDSAAQALVMERSRFDQVFTLLLRESPMPTTNVLSHSSRILSAGMWEDAAPGSINDLRSIACGSDSDPCYYIPATTIQYDSSLADVLALYAGTRTIANSLRYMQVYVLSVEPAVVLPAASQRIEYSFEVTGEGLQEPGITIKELVFGPMNCSDPFTVPGQGKKLGCKVFAPSLWSSDYVYYRITTTTSGGLVTET